VDEWLCDKPFHDAQGRNRLTDGNAESRNRDNKKPDVSQRPALSFKTKRSD